MMIAAFAEAGHAFDEASYIETAQHAATSVWDNFWTVSACLKRSRFRGTSSLDARQTDYAWLADGLIALYDAEGDSVWLDRASTLMNEMEEKFAAVEGGYYLGDDSVGGTTLVSRPRDIHDASTPSGNGVALSVFARLHDRTGERNFDQTAQRLVSTFAGLLTEQRGGLSAMLSGLGMHTENGRARIQFAGRGTARAEAHATADGRVEVQVSLADGWHLNSAEPLQDYLIGVDLLDGAGQSLADRSFPSPTVRKLAFQSEELSLYEEDVKITATLPLERDDIGQAQVSMRLQVCSAEVCLAPEKLEWSLLPLES